MNTCIACMGTGKRLVDLNSHGVARFEQCPWCGGSGQTDLVTSQYYKKALSKVMGVPIPKLKTKGAKAVSDTVPNPFTEAMKSVGKRVGKEMVNSAGRKAAAGATNKLFELSKETFGDKFPMMFQTMYGEKATKFGVPIALLLLCGIAENLGHEAVPIPPKLLGAVGAGAGAALAGVSDETIEEVFEGMIPFLMKVAEIGTGVAHLKLKAGNDKLEAGTDEPSGPVVVEDVG